MNQKTASLGRKHPNFSKHGKRRASSFLVSFCLGDAFFLFLGNRGVGATLNLGLGCFVGFLCLHFGYFGGFRGAESKDFSWRTFWRPRLDTRKLRYELGVNLSRMRGAEEERSRSKRELAIDGKRGKGGAWAWDISPAHRDRRCFFALSLIHMPARSWMGGFAKPQDRSRPLVFWDKSMISKGTRRKEAVEIFFGDSQNSLNTKTLQNAPLASSPSLARYWPSGLLPAGSTLPTTLQ